MTHYSILVLVKKWWESNVLKTPVKYNDLHISFFNVTDFDQNYMQMTNLKKLPEYWPFQIIQNFRNSSRSSIIVRNSSIYSKRKPFELSPFLLQELVLSLFSRSLIFFISTHFINFMFLVLYSQTLIGLFPPSSILIVIFMII